MIRALALVIGAVLLTAVAPGPRASAAGEVTACTEAALDAAIAGGGTVTFACDGVIPVTATKFVPSGTTLVLDGAGRAVTLDGGGTVQLFVVAPGGALHLNALTVVRGRAFQGGAVRNEGALRASASVFTGHVSLDRGGAIGSFGPTATLRIEDCRFEGNTGFGGGAVANGSFVGLRGNMTIVRSTFVENSAQFGGAVLTGGDAVEIADSLFEQNTTSENGGAIVNSRNLTVVRSAFAFNAAATSGGAIDNGFGGVLRVNRSTFTDQVATGGGGAVRNFGSAQIVNSDFSRNSSGSGGAVWSFGSSEASELVVEHSQFRTNAAADMGGALSINGVRARVTFSQFEGNGANRGGAVAAFPALTLPAVEIRHSGFRRNEAEAQGGAIFAWAATGLTFTQVMHNTAPTGGGIFNFGSLAMDHVVAAGNESEDCASQSPGIILDEGHNVIQDGSCGF